MRSIYTLIIIFSLGVLTSSCTSNKAKQEKTQDIYADQAIVEVLELETYLNQLKEEQRPHYFVDVRTPQEVAEGTIGDAINIDYKAEDFLEKFRELDKEQPLYLFCRSGNRSGKATKLLVADGFKEIYDLEGGYLKYTAEQQ